MWLPLALLAAFFAALVAIFGKIGLDKVDPIFATTLRAFVMFCFVLLISIGTKKINFSSLDKHAVTFILLSGIAGALSWIFYFSALKLGDPSKISSIDRLSVVFVVLLAAAFALEKLTLLKVAGALLMVAGAVVISL